MNHTSSRFDDSAELDANGRREYSYIGTLFDFPNGLGRGFVVRVYDDEPEEASFLYSYEQFGTKRIQKRIEDVPYDDMFFLSVARHLFANHGIKELKALTSQSGGYVSVRI